MSTKEHQHRPELIPLYVNQSHRILDPYHALALGSSQIRVQIVILLKRSSSKNLSVLLSHTH